MRYLLITFVVACALASGCLAKIFEKCELARLLEKKHGMPRDDVKNWVCIAQYESTFNTEAINHANWDGSKDYGLFQLNNKYWCDEDYGKNECKMPCSDLLDDDLTDDLACIKKIIRDTERWKGKGTGLTAWVAYVKRCENRNLDEYIAECWTEDSQDSNIINVKDESEKESVTEKEKEESAQKESNSENGSASGTKENDQASSGADTADSPIINLVRVPIMFQGHKFPYFQHMVNPYGYISQIRYQ